MDMKQFSASCTISEVDDIPDTIAVAYAKAIQEEIDNEILVEMMRMQGWHIVKLERFKDMKHPIDVKDWCAENIGDGWSNFGPTFLFNELKHAEWFMLRWL